MIATVPAWIFWLSVLLITTGSLVPGDMLPPQTFDVWDKAQHALGHGWVALCGLVAYGHRARPLVVGLLCWGGAIELLQAASGWRQGDPLDLLANATGVAAALLLWGVVRAWRARTMAP